MLVSDARTMNITYMGQTRRGRSKIQHSAQGSLFPPPPVCVSFLSCSVSVSLPLCHSSASSSLSPSSKWPLSLILSFTFSLSLSFLTSILLSLLHSFVLSLTRLEKHAPTILVVWSPDLKAKEGVKNPQN